MPLFDPAARDPDDLSDLAETPHAIEDPDRAEPGTPRTCVCASPIVPGPDSDGELRCWRCGHTPPRDEGPTT
jgi:hypothetical protein